jgi:uncharacterized protein (TIGR02246 family)
MTNEEQIRQLIENWTAAVKRKDINNILAHHSEDLIMFDVPPPFQSVGIDAYRKTWDTFFKYTKLGVFDIQELKIIADDNVAFCIATMKCEDSTGGKGFEPLNFRLTVGFKKIDNQWTIVHEHHSVPST